MPAKEIVLDVSYTRDEAIAEGVLVDLSPRFYGALFRNPRFPLGRIFATPGAVAVFDTAREGLALELLRRHVQGDWGEATPPEDAATNEQALQTGGQILSAYRLPHDVTL
jgi:hypothetical protein